MTEATADKGFRALSDEDVKMTISAFLETRDRQGGTEDEMATVVTEVGEWAIAGALLELLRAGRLAIDLKDGEVVVSAKAEAAA